MSQVLKKFVCLFALLHCSSALPPATSHQSMVSGEGWRYSYGIVHGPKGVGYATGESYPHGYGGFGTYAPSYGHGSYGLAGHHLPPSHPVVTAHPGLVSDPVLTSYLEHHEIAPLVLHHEPHHVPLIPHQYAPSHEIVIGKPEHHEIVPSHEIVFSKPEHHEIVPSHEIVFSKPEHHEIVFSKPEYVSPHPPVHASHEIVFSKPEFVSPHPPVHASHEVISSPPVVVGKPGHFDNDYSSLFDSYKKLYSGPYSYGLPTYKDAHYSFEAPYTFGSPKSYGPSYSHDHSPVSFSFSYHR